MLWGVFYTVLIMVSVSGDAGDVAFLLVVSISPLQSFPEFATSDKVLIDRYYYFTSFFPKPASHARALSLPAALSAGGKEALQPGGAVQPFSMRPRHQKSLLP